MADLRITFFSYYANMKSKKTSYLSLFGEFFKLGFLMTGGGSISMFSLIKDMFVDKLSWVSEEELVDYYTLAQCSPGIMTINIAAFIGYKQKRVLGAIVATLGTCISAFLPIILIALVITKLQSIQVVRNAGLGVSVGVCVLIMFVAKSMWKPTMLDLVSYIIFGLTLLGTIIWNVSPVYLIIMSAIIGIIYKFLSSIKDEII